MFSLIINTTLVILLIVNTIADYKKIKIEKENNKLYQSVKEKVSEVQTKLHSYVEDQVKDSISFEQLAERVADKLKERIERII